MISNSQIRGKISAIGLALVLGVTGMVAPARAADLVPELVKDINLATTDTDFGDHSAVMNDVLYFVADVGSQGFELWRTDGTAGGTSLVKDINPNGDSLDPSSFNGQISQEFVVFQGELYFTATDGVHGFEMWKTDGTSDGTVMVADLNAGDSDSAPSFLTPFGDHLYFAANNGSAGIEIWRLDGNYSGSFPIDPSVNTEALKLFDVNPTAGASSEPAFLTVFNSALYFAAQTEGVGRELFRILQNGTIEVAHDIDTYVDPSTNQGSGSFPTNLTVLGSELIFVADDGGDELFKTDGTTLTVVRDIYPSGDAFWTGFSYVDFQFTEFNGALFFLANDGTGERSSLWRTDGTTAGTQRVVDNLTGNKLADAELYGNGELNLLVSGSSLYFAAKSSAGVELWQVTPGPTSGDYSAVLHELVSGSIGGNPRYLTEMGGDIYFEADVPGFDRELWKLSGGTLSLVQDTQSPGLDDGLHHFESLVRFKFDDSFPSYTRTYKVRPTLGKLTVNGQERLIYPAPSYEFGMELFISDGTDSGTNLLVDLTNQSTRGSYLGSEESYASGIGDKIVFNAFNTSGNYSIWVSDGTSNGTVQLTETQTDSSGNGYPSNFVEVGGDLYFTARSLDTGGTELWVLDGMTPGTPRRLTTGAGNPGDLVEFDGKLFFFAANSPNLGLFSTDGTSVTLVKEIRYNPGYLTVFGNKLAFAAGDTQNETQLWVSDGSPTGTVEVEINPAGSANVQNLAVVGDQLFFAAQRNAGLEPWIFDGTSARQLGDLYFGASDSYPSSFVGFGDDVYFTADASGSLPGQIWRYDGQSLVRLAPSTGYEFARSLTVMGEELFFRTRDTDGNFGDELWKTDGTSEGTLMVKDINTGSSDSNPSGLLVFNGLLYFSANDGTRGTELWSSDGSEEGTQLVVDIRQGSSSSSPKHLINVGDTLLFIANDGIKGNELWKLSLASDAPAPASSNPFNGPVVEENRQTAVQGESVTISGQRLDQITAVSVAGKEATIESQTAGSITFILAPDTPLGITDILLSGSFGNLALQDAIEVLQRALGATAGEVSGWTKKQPDGTIKLYAKNAVGAGKIQFFQNGREIAWIRAVDETDPKLRRITEGPMAGTNYLVRTVNLLPGKNALEIYIEGERVWRAAYTLSN